MHSRIVVCIHIEPLAKVVQVVRQAHHERQKGNDFNPTSVRPELVEGHFLTFARGSYFKNFYRANTWHARLDTILDNLPEGTKFFMLQTIESVIPCLAMDECNKLSW
jgi:hypothetical protein